MQFGGSCGAQEAARTKEVRRHLPRHDNCSFPLRRSGPPPKPHRTTGFHPTYSPFLLLHILFLLHPSIIIVPFTFTFISNTLPPQNSSHFLTQRISPSSPFIIPGFRGAFGLLPRPFLPVIRVARPFHTFRASLKLNQHHQTPKAAIYAGVMESSDDDVPLRAMKMKTNGVKSGKNPSHTASMQDIRALSIPGFPHQSHIFIQDPSSFTQLLTLLP